MRIKTVMFMLAVSPASAFALDQAVHQSISHDACRDAGLTQDFCERVGTEAYNVDSYEWSTPAAHSQIADDQLASPCTAANQVLERERTLGSDIRTSLGQLNSSNTEQARIHIATQLGRALHTIQDDCAHHGMPNAQHAWWSRLDACSGSKTSPDLQPEAASCARSETAAVFAAFKQEMAQTGVSAASLDDVPEGWTHWPTRGNVCSFLHDAETWDGNDRRWNNVVVVPWVRDQLTNAITSDDSSLGDLCSANLAVERPDALVNVSSPPPFCLKLKAFCVASGGKEDGEEVAPPWEDDAPQDSQSGGCSIDSHDSPASWLLVAFVGLGLVGFRRRR
jgi:MYXO-CTERM domain-containing protein